MSIKDNIRAADDVFEETFGRGHAEGMAKLYTADGMLLPTGSDIIQGRSAIAAFWKGATDMGVKPIKLDPKEVEQHGDAVVELGQYKLSGDGGVSIDHGKYMVVWMQDGGKWKLHRDIWNSSQAPA